MLIATATMNSDNISDNCTRLWQHWASLYKSSVEMLVNLLSLPVKCHTALLLLPEEMLSCAMLLPLANPDAQCAR